MTDDAQDPLREHLRERQDTPAAEKSPRSRAQLERAERMKRIEQAYIAAQLDAGIAPGRAIAFRSLPLPDRRLLERFAVRIEESIGGSD